MVLFEVQEKKEFVLYHFCTVLVRIFTGRSKSFEPLVFFGQLLEFSKFIHLLTVFFQNDNTDVLVNGKKED